jgi:hypothetical protein
MTTYSMTAVCSVLGIARRTAYYVVRARPDGRYHRSDDATVLEQIRAVTNSRATYGYRRVWGDGEPDISCRLQSQAHSADHAAPQVDARAASSSTAWPTACRPDSASGGQLALVL